MRQAPSEASAATVEQEVAETAEQHMLRRTRDFNVAVRERPHDLQLWLDFAAFQDELGGYAAYSSVTSCASRHCSFDSTHDTCNLEDSMYNGVRYSCSS